MRIFGTFGRKFSSLCNSDLQPHIPLQVNHLLQICSKSRALRPGKQTHQQIVVHGHQQNPFISTKLVQTYADCNDIQSTLRVFDKLSEPNVYAWTAIISFFSRNGIFYECVNTYKEMKIMGVLPDNYVFPKVLKVCAANFCLEVGAQLHKELIMCGAGYNIQVSNALIDMYFKCGEVESGRLVFDGMMGRDLLSWNSMISGYVFNGILELAVDIVAFMRLEGIEPDIVTCNTVMDAYCRMGQCDEALRVFRQIEEPNIISWTTLISGYSRIGKGEVTLEIFRNMMHKGEVCADLDCLSSVLALCQHMGALRCGKEIHAYGTKSELGSAFYKSAGPALSILYAKYGRTRDAGHVFGLMDRSDVVTYNARILGLVDLGMKDLALECFREMQSMGIKSNQTTISTVLPVCELKLGKQIHACILKDDWSSVTPVWNALIHMYAKCGSIYTAHSLFSQMKSRDLVSWNTMIGGYGMHGFGQAALQLLQEMNSSGIRPNASTFTSVLSACSHAGLLDEGLEIFQRMSTDFGTDPGMEHFTCLVDLLARAGRLEEAVDLIREMPYEADKNIWGSVLAASLAQQSIRIGVVASEHLVQLEPGNAGHYVTLSNMYAKAGRTDDAVKVRKLMESSGLVKQFGYSSIAGGS